jgi:dienelactone hydrolase
VSSPAGRNGLVTVPADTVWHYRGYDYLGERLAGKGFVVVSIGTSGINPANPGAAYTDRAHLINNHLEMWQKLSATGGGELAGKFVDASTGRPRAVDFKGQVDLSNVGIMGHSRGGMAAMLHSSQEWKPTWPAGVQVKAVLPTGAVYNFAEPAEVTTVPFAVLGGTCDSINGSRYFDDVKGRNKAPIHEFSLYGANHNFFNTQWAPAGGQAGAVDDASHEGLPPGQCSDGRAGSTPARQLTKDQQRTVGSAYASAFFQRYLQGRTEFEPMLTGQPHPFSRITKVDTRFADRVPA